jgi:hypothetical protein
MAAIWLAVVNRGWPAAAVVPALLMVANDPVTYSPARLAEAGPWWDGTPATPDADEDDELIRELEDRLDALDGGRVALQRQARAELRTEQLPVTRATVLRRACEILDRQLAG